MSDRGISAEVLVARLRAGLLVLAAAGVAGTAVELAMIRHWQSTEQLIPWAALAVIAAAIAAVAWRPVAARVRAAQLFAAAVVLSAAYGVLEHISSNLHAGLDPRGRRPRERHRRCGANVTWVSGPLRSWSWLRS